MDLLLEVPIVAWIFVLLIGLAVAHWRASRKKERQQKEMLEAIRAEKKKSGT